jgi:hypothetical protein
VIAAHFLLEFARAPFFGLARTLVGGPRAFSDALNGAAARHLKGACARLAIAGSAVSALTENDLHAA